MMRALRHSLRCGQALTAAALAVTLSSSLHAAEAAKRALLFAKALSYERRLSATKGPSVGIIAIYAADNPASKAAAERWIESFGAAGSLRVDGAPIEAIAGAYDPEWIRERIRAKGIDVLVACEGVTYSAVSALAAEHEILSAADTPGGVEKHLSLGVFVGGSKPRVMINMRVARREGAKFSAKLLQIAEVL